MEIFYDTEAIKINVLNVTTVNHLNILILFGLFKNLK